MREIAGVIGLIMALILICSSEQFRDIVKIGLLGYISYNLYELIKILK